MKKGQEKRRRREEGGGGEKERVKVPLTIAAGTIKHQ